VSADAGDKTPAKPKAARTSTSSNCRKSTPARKAAPRRPASGSKPAGTTSATKATRAPTHSPAPATDPVAPRAEVVGPAAQPPATPRPRAKDVAAASPAAAPMMARAHAGRRTPRPSMSPLAKMMAGAAGAALVVVALALARDLVGRASVAVNAAAASPAHAAEATVAVPESVPPARADRQPHVEPSPSSPDVKARGTILPASKAAREPAVATRQVPAPVTTNAAAPPTVAAAPIVSAATRDSLAGGDASAPETSAASASAGPAAPGAANTTARAQPTVTITGCLEGTSDGEDFRLTETDGAAAPKSRGWRSGFLKKRSAPVSLIAASDASAWRKYIGQRVAVSGVLDSRELQVRSLRPSGGACD
jgi:hypothetical protein